MATGDPWQAFVEFAEQHGGPTFSAAVAAALGLEAIAVLRQQALRGNTRAAIYLCDRWLGQPEIPFSARLEGMNAEEAREELIQRRMEGLGMDRAAAERDVELMAAFRARRALASAEDEEGTDGDG